MPKKSKPKVIFLDEDRIDILWEQKLGSFDGKGGHEPGGDYGRSRIRMGKGMPRRMLRGVLMHESLHGVWERALGDRYSEATEEVIVDYLAPWILDMLRRNPDLVEFLTEDDDV